MKRLIKNILLEYYAEESWDYSGDIYPEKVYRGLFKIFDKQGKNFIKEIEYLNITSEEEYDQVEREINLVLKYLTDYEDRPKIYIDFSIDSEDLSKLFYDGDYEIQRIVKDYLDGDFDYGYDYECFDFDDWLIDRIDSENMNKLKELYLKNLNDEESEEDFREFIESEYGSTIGCAAGDAQYSADIGSLHSDIVHSIESSLQHLGGSLNRQDYGVIKYEAKIEIGELVNSPFFIEILEYYLGEGYPDLEDIFYAIIDQEKDNLTRETNYFYPNEKISIDVDRHFRYGGSGDIDWKFFNEILSDKLNWG